MGGIKFRRVFFFKSHYNEENDKPDHEFKKKIKEDDDDDDNDEVRSTRFDATTVPHDKQKCPLVGF